MVVHSLESLPVSTRTDFQNAFQERVTADQSSTRFSEVSSDQFAVYEGANARALQIEEIAHVAS